MTNSLANEPELRLGGAVLRPPTCELVHGGFAESLEPRVMQVLLVLARNVGHVVSRDMLVELCWSGRSVSEDALNRVISRVRRLSERTGAFTLTTIRAVGYRVDAVDGASPEPPLLPAVDQIGRRSRRTRLVAYALFGVGVMACIALALWVLQAQPPRPDGSRRSETPTIAVMPEVAMGAEAEARLAAQLRLTLSQMRGLRVVGGAGVQPGTIGPDLVLNGVVSGGADQPVISLSVDDASSGARLWGATFDSRTNKVLGAQDRAVYSAARYLALWLGERRVGAVALREPENPEVARIVAGAERLIGSANGARDKRDWVNHQRLMARAAKASAEALAIDPGSARALMLRYQTLVNPLFPLPGESDGQFRQRSAEAAAAVARALAANPDDPRVLVAAAEQLRRSLRWNDARKLLERAVVLEPNSADANTWYAYALGLLNRCDEGLRHARVASALEPDSTWRQLAVPRLLHCAGRRQEAATAYRTLLMQDRSNVFMLREWYLMLFGQRDPAAMRRLVNLTRVQLWAGQPPPPVAAMLARIDAAAAALDGIPAPFVKLVRGDLYGIRQGTLNNGTFGRSRGDGIFVLAFELAQAGQSAAAIDLFREAVDQGSVYLPWALPYGSTSLPVAVSRDPRYLAVWRSSPAMVSLMNERRRNARRPDR